MRSTFPRNPYGTGRLDVPDLLGVLVDGAVGVERPEKAVEMMETRPAGLVLVRLVNLRLALDVALEILRHEEVVAAAEAFVALQGSQERSNSPGAPKVPALMQSITAVNDAGGTCRRHARRARARPALDANRKKFSSSTFADLDVGAVQRADDQAAVHLELHVDVPEASCPRWRCAARAPTRMSVSARTRCSRARTQP